MRSFVLNPDGSTKLHFGFTTHVLLLDDLRVELEVDVLDPLEVNPAHVAGGGGLGLEQLLPLLQDGHHLRLVLQPVHVLIAVGVAALQHLWREQGKEHVLRMGREQVKE